MKSTYKILTVDLDRKPFAKNVPVKIWTAKEENLFGLEAEYNLFDYPYSKRVVFGTMLLMEKLQSISNRINQLEFINELIIKIDYDSSLPVINRLFLRRILQPRKDVWRCIPAVHCKQSSVQDRWRRL